MQTCPAWKRHLRVPAFVFSTLLCSINTGHAASLAPDPIEPMRELMAQPVADLDLARAKLAIDRLIDPTIDVAATLQQLDALAATIRSGFPPNADNRQKLETLLVFLYRPGPWNDGHPFTYDLADPFGKNLRNKLLPTYLRTGKGNCVSMPILVAILGQKLDLPVTLATAPEHVLVKFQDTNGQWLNVEATAGGYETNDGYVRRLGISKQALANQIYLRPLDQHEAIAVMLSTLMEFYGQQGQVALQIMLADLALTTNPKDVFALIQKASGYYVLLQRRYIDRYPTPADIPPRQRQDYQQLSAGNLQLFSEAESLGWIEPDTAKESSYLQSIEHEKASRRK